jgi:hypothetical protein
MYTNQQASQVHQSITHYTKKCNTHTFMDILNSPEYIDKSKPYFLHKENSIWTPILTNQSTRQINLS